MTTRIGPDEGTSLAIMALAVRAMDYLLRELKGGSLQETPDEMMQVQDATGSH